MISFIYFDVGGVIIKDFSASNKWADMERDLGITDSTQTQFLAFWDKYKDDICCGTDIDTLIPALQTECDLHLSSDYSWLMDFVDRFEPNYTIWNFVTTLPSSIGIGLLTDMYPRMLDSIAASGLLPPVSWDAIIDSSVEGCKKPNQEIYVRAEEHAGVNGSDIFFIDNSQKNLDAAAQRGWQTFFYDSRDYEQSSAQLAQLVIQYSTGKKNKISL